MTSQTPDAPQIENWMRQKIAAELKVASDEIGVTQPLSALGLDSITVFTLTGDLAEWLDCDLRATLLWEYPMIAELAQYLANGQLENAQ